MLMNVTAVHVQIAYLRLHLHVIHLYTAYIYMLSYVCVTCRVVMGASEAVTADDGEDSSGGTGAADTDGDEEQGSS